MRDVLQYLIDEEFVAIYHWKYKNKIPVGTVWHTKSVEYNKLPSGNHRFRFDGHDYIYNESDDIFSKYGVKVNSMTQAIKIIDAKDKKLLQVSFKFKSNYKKIQNLKTI